MDKERPNTEDRVNQMQADLCKMLSHPTRLKIIKQLKQGEKTVSELESEIDASQSSLSQHLSELRKSKVVENRRDGNSVHYKIAYPKLVKACNLIREVLFDQLSKNQDLIEGGVNNERKR